MSEQNAPKSKQRSGSMYALIAGMLAIAMVGAFIVGGQGLSATAQQQNSTDPMPVDIGCPTGAETCEDELENVKSTVSTSGTSTAKVTPDKVSVTVGVETQAETAAEAAAENAKQMEKLLAALKALGISDDQIGTSNYSVYPVYEYRSPPCIEIYPQPPECAPKSEVVGYKASNFVTLTLDADEDVGEVLDEAVKAGANNVSGVYFFVSGARQNEIRDSLIGKAIANAKSRADKAAEAVNMEITGVKSINLNDVYFPVFYKEVAQSAVDQGATTPILPGQQDVTMTVQVTYIMS